MNKINKIDPSIAFCAKSAAANYNHYFDNKAVIYRKLINGFNDELQKDCFIAIDTSQQPKQGDLTLFDFDTDSERLTEFNGESNALGKVIAYSDANNLGQFFKLRTLTPAPTEQRSVSHLSEITPDDINRFSGALKALLDSDLLKPELYNDLYQLRSSLDTFESLLLAEDDKQAAMEVNS